MMKKLVEVVPYNPAWPEMFEAEAQKIKEALADICIQIHHIGSTSVPGLSAKPKIDIIVVIKTDTDPISKLEAIGYEYRGEYNIPFHFGFAKVVGTRINLHVYEEGNPEIKLNILFRDYLRNHAEICDQYQKLKMDLIKEDASHMKNESIFNGYTLNKNDFIQRILQKTGFDELCLRFCTHHQEWEAAKKFRQMYFLDRTPMTDPDTWIFNHKDHIHFILYKGSQIIGYAHIELCQENRAILHMIGLDEQYEDLKYGGHLLSLCEKWLKRKGIKTLQTESTS